MAARRFFPELIILALLMLYIPGRAQRYGLPGIRNFLRSEYLGGTQNWSFGQAENGLVYFGNNYGLLEYDGARWTLHPELGLVIRAICVDGNKVYAGAFNQFGYFEEDEKGMLRYHSLISLLDDRISDFDEIWRIHKTSFGIVFQSFKAMFVYDGKKIEIIRPKSQFHFSYYVNGQLWVYDENEGLMHFRDGKLRQIRDGGAFAGKQVWTILPLGDDQVIVGTAQEGIFCYDGERFRPWNTLISNLMKKYHLFSGAIINTKYFAFGTIQNGVIISDTAGEVVCEINKERGLANNTALCIGNDKEGNVWTGLDNGISLLFFNSPLTYIQNYFNLGTGYASERFGEYFYLGTNQGLFCIRWIDFLNPLKKSTDFKLIEGTEGQVWSLTNTGNSLICGHHRGIFSISNNKAERISSVPGGWNVIRLQNRAYYLIAGHYAGLSVFEWKNRRWVYRNEIKGYDQSSHYLFEDSEGYIWVSHGYKGIFRLKTDVELRNIAEVRFYNSKNGLPSDAGNTLYQLKSGFVVATRYGIYSYNEKGDRFEPEAQFAQVTPPFRQVDYLMQDRKKNIWYYNNLQPGVLRYQEDGAYTNIVAPFFELDGMVIPAFGHVNDLDAENALIGIEGGFAHYNSEHYQYFNLIPTLHLSRIQSADTSEGIYHFNSMLSEQQVIPHFRHTNNAITLQFSASIFSGSRISYQHMLKGFDKEWSEWSSQNNKGYTNLPAGDYTFRLRAMSAQGKISPVLSYSFRILPPWYGSVYAWIVYFILTGMLIFLSYRFFVATLEKSRHKAEVAQKLKFRQREHEIKEKSLETEREMISLRNEKLRLEMIHQEKELANSTMMIIQKNEILGKIRQDLEKIRSGIPDEQQKNELRNTIKKIGREIDNEKQWLVFNTHVEQVHEELFKKLKTTYPSLTPRELSLCAYLRMNISSKEIATLMNISTRGIEISRYRIRKKLGLDRNANLTEFMMSM